MFLVRILPYKAAAHLGSRQLTKCWNRAIIIYNYTAKTEKTDLILSRVCVIAFHRAIVCIIGCCKVVCTSVSPYFCLSIRAECGGVSYADGERDSGSGAVGV